jgi:hypothetical protein
MEIVQDTKLEVAKKLTPKQQKALMALALGQTNEKAAEAAGVSQSAVAAWLKREEFKRELRSAMERIRSMFEGRIMALASNAAAVVQDLMNATTVVNNKVVPDMELRAKGANLALSAAVKIATRYKELQVEGYAPPAAPLIVFPSGTVMPWNNTQSLKSLPVTIDVEADIVGDEPDNSAE